MNVTNAMYRKPATEYTPDELAMVDAKVVEQEISLAAYRGENYYDVWITDNLMLGKLKRLMRKAPDLCALKKVEWHTDGTVAGYKFRVDKRCVRFQAPPLAPRALTEEEKERKRELLRTYRARPKA